MKIRLPADLKEEIEAASKQSGRSMNAEIVARIEQSFRADEPVNRTPTRELMAMAFFAGHNTEPGSTLEFVALLDRMFPKSGAGDEQIENWLDRVRSGLPPAP